MSMTQLTASQKTGPQSHNSKKLNSATSHVSSERTSGSRKDSVRLTP